MSHPWLFSHALTSTSTSSSSSPTYPTTQRENSVHPAHLQVLSVDKLPRQESLWGKDLQSGGNPRTTIHTKTCHPHRILVWHGSCSLHSDQEERFRLCVDAGKQYGLHMLQRTSRDRTQLRWSGVLWISEPKVAYVGFSENSPGLVMEIQRPCVDGCHSGGNAIGHRVSLGTGVGHGRQDLDWKETHRGNVCSFYNENMSMLQRCWIPWRDCDWGFNQVRASWLWNHENVIKQSSGELEVLMNLVCRLVDRQFAHDRLSWNRVLIISRWWISAIVFSEFQLVAFGHQSIHLVKSLCRSDQNLRCKFQWVNSFIGSAAEVLFALHVLVLCVDSCESFYGLSQARVYSWNRRTCDATREACTEFTVLNTTRYTCVILRVIGMHGHARCNWLHSSAVVHSEEHSAQDTGSHSISSNIFCGGFRGSVSEKREKKNTVWIHVGLGNPPNIWSCLKFNLYQDKAIWKKNFKLEFYSWLCSVIDINNLIKLAFSVDGWSISNLTSILPI